MSKTDVKERVKRALSMVQLDAFAGRYPAQLSGGQQQRVALARALVFEPQLVLMDEPLGALDKQLREHMQMEIKHLHQRLGVTVVYVTHDQGEALTMSDRVAVFHQGEIQQIEPPRISTSSRATPSWPTSSVRTTVYPGSFSVATASAAWSDCRAAKVEALAVNVGQPGEPVTLSIRPERVRLNGASESCVNRFSGRVAGSSTWATTCVCAWRSAAATTSSSSSRSPSWTRR